MESGFDLEMYETVFINCFIECSRYANGNLKLSLYGTDVKTEETAHFADITLENNKIRLPENEVIVDNRFKPTLIPQLKKLGILKDKLSMCIVNDTFYPIYSINYSNVLKNRYRLLDLIAA